MLKNVLGMTELFSQVLQQIVTTAKSFLDAAELINFNKGEAISQCWKFIHAPAKKE